MIDLEKNPIITVHYSYYHGILPFEEIKIGQTWVGSCGNKVQIIDIRDKQIYYQDLINNLFYDKDYFSFQCRYSLLVE